MLVFGKPKISHYKQSDGQPNKPTDNQTNGPTHHYRVMVTADDKKHFEPFKISILERQLDRWVNRYYRQYYASLGCFLPLPPPRFSKYLFEDVVHVGSGASPVHRVLGLPCGEGVRTAGFSVHREFPVGFVGRRSGSVAAIVSPIAETHTVRGAVEGGGRGSGKKKLHLRLFEAALLWKDRACRGFNFRKRCYPNERFYGDLRTDNRY